MKTNFFNVELGLPTILTLYWTRHYLKNALDLLAIWYYTNHKNSLREFNQKHLWELTKDEFENFLKKDEDKIYLKLTVEMLLNYKKVVDEINELSKAFIIEEKPVETNEDEAIEILIGSLLNSGIPIEKVFSTTLLELNLRNKAIKYQLSKLKEMKI
ncbi:MAG: hypothetical protein ABIL49_07455 [candidate division WOR-3 bacterium]